MLTVRTASRLISLLVVGILLTNGLALTATNSTDASARTPAKELASRLSETPAGEQLSWALEQINDGGSTLTADAISDRFTDTFLSALPADDLIGVFTNYLAPNGPMTV